MKKNVIFGVLCSLFVSCAPNMDTDSERATRELIEQQAGAWSAGDLEGFMAVYERSPEIVFVTPDSTLVGFDALLARYRDRYPDSAAMGKLSFSDLEISDMGEGHVLVVGGWHLQRESDPLNGRFLTIFRHTEAGWRIVVDYTLQGGG